MTSRRSAQRVGPDGPTPDSPADLVENADPESVARAICLRQLTLGPRTRSQLADLLARRGVPEDAAQRVLDRFTEVGLIDDASFARQWVESRHHGRGLARRALAQEMRRKGVADEEVSDALSAIDGEAEADMAAALGRAQVADDPAAGARCPGPAAGRHADPQGLLAGAGARGGPRGARG